MLFLLFFVASFFALRAWWISAQDDSITIYAPLILATIGGVYVGFKHWKWTTIFLLAGLIGFLTSASFALEMVCHSADAMFHRDRIAEMYFDAPKLNAIRVAITTLFATAVGGISRLAVSSFRRQNKGCQGQNKGAKMTNENRG